MELTLDRVGVRSVEEVVVVMLPLVANGLLLSRGAMEGGVHIGCVFALVGGCCVTVSDSRLTSGTGGGPGLVGGVGFKPQDCCRELLELRSDIATIDIAGRSISVCRSLGRLSR